MARERLVPLLRCLLLLSLLHSRETYNSLAAWLTDARTLASPNIVVILCGNKKDLDPEREVTFLEASRFAQENGEGRAVGPVMDGGMASPLWPMRLLAFAGWLYLKHGGFSRPGVTLC